MDGDQAFIPLGLSGGRYRTCHVGVFAHPGARSSVATVRRSSLGGKRVTLWTEGLDVEGQIIPWSQVARAAFDDNFVRVTSLKKHSITDIPLRAFIDPDHCEYFVQVVNAYSLAAKSGAPPILPERRYSTWPSVRNDPPVPG